MSRPLRIEFENAFYHVMNRGRGRENTFLSDDDFKYFLYCIEQASLRFNIEVHSYCLMTNHYHLLIKTPDANLGRAMKHINGLYTQYFNREHIIQMVRCLEGATKRYLWMQITIYCMLVDTFTVTQLKRVTLW